MGTVQITPGDSGQLIIRFPYSPERVAAVRAVPGRRWHPEEKYWTIPYSPKTLERVRSLFTGDRVVVAAAVEAAASELPVARVQKDASDRWVTQSENRPNQHVEPTRSARPLHSLALRAAHAYAISTPVR
jgi:hypothetical protein